MAHSAYIEMDQPIALTARAEQRLLRIARDSISTGLATGSALRPDRATLDDALRVHLASFVTLTKGVSLRGCIGSLQCKRPLARDVAENAFNAAMHDSRFTPVRAEELAMLEIEVAVLSPPSSIECASETELLTRIVPYEDGLILEDGAHRSTFLPKVWTRIPDPRDFVRELKRKAGLSPDYWSRSIRFRRYRTVSFGD